MRRVRPLVAALLCGCSSPPTGPVVALVPGAVDPPVVTAARVEATAAPSPPARPSRRGQCGLDDAFADFFGGEQALRCGDLSSGASLAEYDAARTCILAAMKARKAFAVTLALQGVDSSFREAYTGRNTGAGYEVRWFSYDSCPSGCGDDDPAWWSRVCHPLVDLRAACALTKAAASEGLRWACDGFHSVPRDQFFSDPRKQARRRLELWCDQSTDGGRCP